MFSTYRSHIFVLTLLSCCLWLFGVATAEDKPDALGPAKVKLSKNLGTLDLPQGYFFFDATKAKAIMQSMGSTGNDTIGLIGPSGKDINFLIELDYEETGYVSDKDAGEIDPKKILESYQEGTEASNDQRKEKGLAAIHVTGWEQEPRYDPQHHVVTWSLQGTNESDGQFVNYNTRMLTRKGVLSVNLMCKNQDLVQAQPKAVGLVSKISFQQGERYEDYQQGDKVSSLGLVGLIAGGALLAKKTGVIAFLYVIMKPLLLFFKVLGAKAIALVVAVFLGVKKILTGKKQSQEPQQSQEQG